MRVGGPHKKEWRQKEEEALEKGEPKNKNKMDEYLLNQYAMA